jgi:hypothetical protein
MRNRTIQEAAEKLPNLCIVVAEAKSFLRGMLCGAPQCGS